MKVIIPKGWAIIPDHNCIPGFVGALVILKIPPDTNGSNNISCSNNEFTWWVFIAPAIMTSSRGLFRIISISYFEPVRTLSGILKIISILLLSVLIVVNKFFIIPSSIFPFRIENN